MRVLILILCVFVGAIACGGDSNPTAPPTTNPPPTPTPTAPDPALVGTWRMSGTNFVEVTEVNLRNHLTSLGYNPIEIELFLTAYTSELEGYFLNSSFFLIRFNSNGTYTDNSGDTGTWTVSGNTITLSSSDGIAAVNSYFVSGNDLTVIFTKTQLEAQIKAASETWTSDDQALFDIIFRANDRVRLFFDKE